MKKAEKIKIAILLALVLPAVFGSLFFYLPRGALTETYLKGVGEDAPVLYSRATRGISFENYAEKVNLIVHHYLMSEHPVPGHFPSHTIRWEGVLEAREPGRYGFRVDASHPVKLLVGGEEIIADSGGGFIFLERGGHGLTIEFYNEDGEKGRNAVNLQIKRGRDYRGVPVGSLRLLWTVPGREGWHPVAPEDFSGVGGGRLPGHMRAPLVFALFLAAGALFLREPSFYSAFFYQHRYAAAVICVAALGFSLRFYQHGVIPFYNETWDEIGCGWGGWSLINWGVPVSWSLLLDAYGPGRAGVEWFGCSYNLVAPFFDHPPLFNLTVGAVAMMRGADELLRVSVYSMRIVPVLFSSAVIVLLYLVLKSGYSRRIALLGSFLYAVVPTVVVSGRLVQEDNMMLFLVMLGLFFYTRSLARESWRASLPVGIFTGLACLAKFSGVVFIPAFSFLYLSRGRRKSALAVFAAGSVIASFYFLYGALIDWGMFLRVFSVQGGKVSQFALPVRFAMQPKLLETLFWDGGVVFLWMSVPALAFMKREGFGRDMGVLFGFYFIAMSVSVIYDRDYGWYRIMMFPFLCAAGAIMLDELMRRNSPLLMVLFSGFAVMLNLQALLPRGMLLNPDIPKLAAGLLVLPVLPVHIWKTRRLEKLALFGIAAALFVYALTSVIIVLNFADLYYGAPWWRGVL